MCCIFNATKNTSEDLEPRGHPGLWGIAGFSNQILGSLFFQIKSLNRLFICLKSLSGNQVGKLWSMYKRKGHPYHFNQIYSSYYRREEFTLCATFLSHGKKLNFKKGVTAWEMWIPYRIISRTNLNWKIGIFNASESGSKSSNMDLSQLTCRPINLPNCSI